MTLNENHSDREQLARASFAQEDYVTAEILFRRLALEFPQDALAQYNWGVTLGKLDRIEEALACYRRTIELNPGFADAYINFSTCLNELNLIAQARKGFALAQQIAPDNPIPKLNEGISALALGDYAAGWEHFSARWQLPHYAKFKRTFSKPYWMGEDLAGKTLFLFCEQGFGDTLQMARFLPRLATQGATIILEAPPALSRLLHSLQGSPTIITKGDPIPDFDYYCSIMEIPRALGTTLDTLPSTTPYLFAAEEEVSAVQAAFPRKQARRIGLSWAGRADHENDRNRSLKFAQLEALQSYQDIEWVSLQRVVSDHDAPALAASPFLDWGKNFSDFAAAAAAIMTLDLVITVDTALAHLAGALGKPVWILLPFYADWRWLVNRKDSPWYPTARLFRQKKRKDWGSVLLRVTKELDGAKKT